MGFKCGIVGLPNVGKSTLFNALTKTVAAEAANYPFCTIEPNVGRVGVPDPRLDTLASLAGSQKIIPTFIDIVDIAGLVKGASSGEGLGNQFLGNIREVDAILHVVRAFENDDITHVDGSVDPVRDVETIETELMLADYENLEKRRTNLTKKSRSGDKESQAQLTLIEKALAFLKAGKPARLLDVSDEEKPLLKQLQLLTSKPILYICNVSEEDAATGNILTQKMHDFATDQGNRSVVISAAIEAEIAALDSEEEKADFLSSIGLTETGLARVIREGYSLLDLLTFFTVGPKEARAWTVKEGAKAPQAAGVIHTDFERGFIRAETIAFEDYEKYGNEQEVKSHGKCRDEGKEYCVKDGDVFHFKFNV